MATGGWDTGGLQVDLRNNHGGYYREENIELF